MEASFQNIFEMLSYASTIVWAKPTEFKWPALLSTAVTWITAGLYAVFVQRRTGHIFHIKSGLTRRSEPGNSRGKAERPETHQAMGAEPATVISR